MTTTEPFDAFERRLVATLTAEAETVGEPDDGLALVRARIAHRRRARRVTWLAAAAALVLVAGTVGILLRSGSTDSAPYVDTDSTGGMPLLGFADGSGRLFQYGPGMSYLVIASGDRPATDGRYLQLVNMGADLGPGSFRWAAETTVSLKGLNVHIGTQTTQDGLGNEVVYGAAWWDAGHGWRATVTTGSKEGTGSRRDELLAAVAQVVQLPQEAWERGQADDPDPVRSFDDPRLLLDPDVGQSQVIAMSANAVTSWLTTNDDALPDAALLALPGTAVQDRLQQGVSPVQVRGVTGSFSTNDGGPRAVLLWVEGGLGYEISAEAGASVEQLTRLAELLVEPGAYEWHALVFPDGPRDFPDSDYFGFDPVGN